MKSIALLFIILTFVGCSKEAIHKTRDKNIVGVWFHEDTLNEYGRISRLQYTFSEENTIEILRIEIEINTRKILGYRYKSSGNYRLENNRLSFSNLVNFTNDDTKASYSAIEDLKLLTEQSNSYMVTCMLEDDNKKLTFLYPPCGELANCIEKESFNKE